MSDTQNQNPRNQLTPEALRLLELLAGESLGGLDAAETEEVHALLRRVPPLRDAEGREIQRGAFDDVVGEIIPVLGDSETTPTTQTALPASLRQSLVAAGERATASRGRTVNTLQPSASSPHSSGVLATVGWQAAAAGFVLAATIYLSRPGPTPPTPPALSNAEQLAALVRDNPTTTARLAWAAQAAAPTVTGEVVWNNELQKGFLRFKGLPTNDPTKEQYQAWVFDGDRATYPVDAGVFDVAGTGGGAEVDPATGDVIIPMNTILHIYKPAMVAVTIEKPGGVVVTDKSRLVAIAKVQ